MKQVQRARRVANSTWPAAHNRPIDIRAYLAWDDEWRSRILDVLASWCGSDRESFAAGALIILAGYQAGYDG